jgi:NAD(P)-dependent dehydrogenase (short-subunit alcohol dehydrogenase family)
MSDRDEFSPTDHHANRRSFLLRGTAVAGATLAGTSLLYAQARTDIEPRTLNGEPVPEPPPQRSAGPVKPGRGSVLTGKLAVVTGAARGIGRAISVEFAANGADVVVLDIAGPVSTASDAKPATPVDLEETLRQVKAYGRKGESMRLDIRDIDGLRKAADRIESTYGKIDIVVANAAIQRWKPLLDMQDAEWRDMIDNNLNGTANTVRAFAPKMVRRRHGRIIVLSSMQGKHGTKDASSYSASKWGILGLMKSAALELGEYNITVKRPDPGTGRYRLDALREALDRKHGRDGPKAVR